MCKKWRYCLRSLVALCCISCMLFSNTLFVSAATSYYDLFESTSPVDESAQSFSLEFHCEATSQYLDISGGTYSGDGSYTGTGSGSTSQTTVTGSVSVSGYTSLKGSFTESGTYSGYVTSSTGRESGTISSSSSNVSLSSQYPNTYSGSISSGTIAAQTISSTDTGSTSSSGTITLTSTHGGSMNMHYKIPLMVQLPYVSGGSLTPNDYYGLTFFPSNIDNSASTLHHITHFRISSSDGKFISDDTARPCYFALGSELLSNNNSFAVVPVFIEFDDFIPRIQGTQGFTSYITFNLTPRLRRIKDSAQSQVGQNITSDIVAHELQEESNEIQEDTNETTHSIFDSISDFFGSFFSNLIGVFVPEDGFFTTWFNNLNTLLTQKLGVLYFPFSVIVDIMNRLATAFDTAQSNNCVIVFPEVNLRMNNETYTVIERHEIDLIDYNVPIYNADTSNSSMFGMSSLIWVIRRLNNFIILFAIIRLFLKKLNLILRGSEEG